MANLSKRPLAAVALALLVGACGSDVRTGLVDAGQLADVSDADAGPTQPDATDVPDADAADPFACRPDDLGATSPQQPAALALDLTLFDLTLCDGESDWFAISAPSTSTVTVVVDAYIDDTAVALELSRGELSADGRVVGGAVEATIGPDAADVLVRVVAAPGTEHLYSIEARAEDPTVGDCPDTSFEPNDTAASAHTLGDLDLTAATWICAGDEDWYLVDLALGEELTAAIAFSHDEGDLELELRDEDGATIDISESGDDNEQVASGPALAAGPVFVRVWGFEGAEAAYTLDVTVRTGATEPGTATGTVVYQDRTYDTDGFTGDLPESPARGMVVEVVRVSDAVTVATGTTDSEGAFDVPFLGSTDEAYIVRVLAVVDTGAHSARVRDRTRQTAIYALESAPTTIAELADGPLTLRALRSDAIGGALNIADVIYDALTFIEQWVEPVAPQLTVSWQPGEAFSCGSCYSRNTISLGGQLEDPDEYDDDIVLHEFGHYFVSYYSADSSPGGSHRDRQVSPELAWGEGLAYFFAGMVRDDQNIVDNFINARRWIDMENVTQNGEALDVLSGTTTGTLEGNLREEVVAGVLWDAYDAASGDEPFDTIALGADGQMRILLDYFGAGIPNDVGPRGIDLSDWLNALVCVGDVSSDAALASAADRDFPWTGDTADCAFKHGAPNPLVLELVQRDVVASGVGPGEFTVLVDRSGTLSKFDVVCDALPCTLVEGVNDDTAVAVNGVRDIYVAASWVGPLALERMLGGAPETVASTRGTVRRYASR